MTLKELTKKYAQVTTKVKKLTKEKERIEKELRKYEKRYHIEYPLAYETTRKVYIIDDVKVKKSVPDYSVIDKSKIPKKDIEYSYLSVREMDNVKKKRK